MSTSDGVTIAAALLAAALSATTLVLTVRREERKWRRESLVDTIVQFMDGSFSLPGNRAYKVLVDGGDLTAIRSAALDGFNECTTALTRLRILAPSDLVGKAEDLHKLDDRITERLLSPSGQPPSLNEWIPMADERAEARQQLLNAARKGLGLGRAREFGRSRHRTDLEA